MFLILAPIGAYYLEMIMNSFSTLKNNDCYDYRKKINLPITKKLIYKDIDNKCHVVSYYIIIKEFNISDYWAVLMLFFEEELEPVKIHSSFFSEMQNPKFKR